MKSVLLLALVGVAFATTGFDAIQSISSSTFSCLASNKYEFFIARVWRSSGSTDETGIVNIKNAKAAGWKYVDGYIFPCTTSSCPAPATQISDVVSKLKSEGANYGMLWLDIERYEWPTDLTKNQNFIIAMGNELDKLGVNWGIYSNYNNWEAIVGVNWNHYDKKQLWWADYNGHQDYTGFKAFGGWTKPNMHQYQGTTAGPCGVSMDLNWY